MALKMKNGMLMALIAISLVFAVDAQLRQNSALPTKKSICVYNSTSFSREGK